MSFRQRIVAAVLVAAIGVPAFALFCFSPLCDSDVGWHLTFGEYIVHHRTIPTEDVFRFTPQESPLHLHGWLSQVAFDTLEQVGGLWFFRLGTSLVMLGTLALLARLLYKTNGSGHLTALGVLVFILTSVHLFHPRARIFTPPLFLLAFEQVALDATPLSGRRLVGLILLAVTWMNLHAEATVLPLFIVVLLLDEGLARPFPRRRVASLALAAALTLGALFASPLGASWLPDAMQNYRVNREYSWEWFNLFAYQTILDQVFSNVSSEQYPMFVHLLGYPSSLAVTMAVAVAYLASLGLRPRARRPFGLNDVGRMPGVVVNLCALVLALNMQRNSWLLFIPIASTLRTLALRFGMSGSAVNLPLVPSVEGTVNKCEAMQAPREPGDESQGSVGQSRPKPTVNASLESLSGDFSTIQPGNSFPGAGPAARKSTVRKGEARGATRQLKDPPPYRGRARGSFLRQWRLAAIAGIRGIL